MSFTIIISTLLLGFIAWDFVKIEQELTNFFTLGKGFVGGLIRVTILTTTTGLISGKILERNKTQVKKEERL